MTTFRNLVVASLVVALLAWPVGAATYYVTAEDPKASDDNNGSAAAPVEIRLRGDSPAFNMRDNRVILCALGGSS